MLVISTYTTLSATEDAPVKTEAVGLEHLGREESRMEQDPVKMPGVWLLESCPLLHLLNCFIFFSVVGAVQAALRCPLGLFFGEGEGEEGQGVGLGTGHGCPLPVGAVSPRTARRWPPVRGPSGQTGQLPARCPRCQQPPLTLLRGM